eukprot:132212_1
MDAGSREMFKGMVLKVLTNGISDHVYGLISKLNHGYPTTVELHIDRDTARALVFATDDLANGTELVWDYCGLLNGQNRWDQILEIAEKHNINLLPSDLESGAWQHIKGYHVSQGRECAEHLESFLRE